VKRIIKKIFEKIGYEIIPLKFPVDMEEEFKEIYSQCRFFSMTSRENMYALYNAVKYLAKNNIPGDLVECGVWKGGSAMLMAYALNPKNRNIYLYDTFSGMAEPETVDQQLADSASARDIWQKTKQKNHNSWCFASLSEVNDNLLKTGYPPQKIFLIEGRVEETIPQIMPKEIALLRLDTDWYKSTKHELEHLFPRLVPGGVLIIDDYGSWAGAQKAIQEYRQENKIKMLLTRIDGTARLGIKI